MFFKKNLVYEPLEPYINKPFSDLDIEEVKEYFKWYQKQIPCRVKYLSMKSHCDLDYSFESLIALWKWFIKVAHIEKVSEKKKKRLVDEFGNQNMKINHILEVEDSQLSVITEFVISDIAMYVGEVFTKYSEKINWGYHIDKKKDSFYNMPILMGFEDATFTPSFKMNFEPNHMVHVQAENLLDKTANEKDLYDMCMVWKKHIH